MHQKSCASCLRNSKILPALLIKQFPQPLKQQLCKPLKKHITNSLHHLLQIQPLTGANMWFCLQCKSNQNATTVSSITKSGSILILKLRRYDNFLDNLFKDNRHVQCLPINTHHLKVPITTSVEVSIAKDYSLVATVNHSGKFASCFCRHEITSSFVTDFDICSISLERSLLYYFFNDIKLGDLSVNES